MAGRALCLFSGGLDSLLAYHMVRRQGVEMQAVWFDMTFQGAHVRMVKEGQDRAWLEAEFERIYGFPVKVIPVWTTFFDALREPSHGFGDNMNPCIDCKIIMLRQARVHLHEHGYDFIVSGEVLGQRPMSQNRASLNLIAKEAGVQDVLLRPLSARHLPASLAEEKGFVRREELGEIRGRSRKPQMALAAEYGITSYPQPAGGCLLTEPRFCDRLGDHLRRGGVLDETTSAMITTGRHFRLATGAKLICGRDLADNTYLERVAAGHILIQPLGPPGPTALLDATPAGEAAVAEACGVVGRYIIRAEGPFTFEVRGPDGRKMTVTAAGADPGLVERMMI
ncbi:MAG: hypothetical protein ABIF71_01260 [Planctomycetota bacterium]